MKRALILVITFLAGLESMASEKIKLSYQPAFHDWIEIQIFTPLEEQKKTILKAYVMGLDENGSLETKRTIEKDISIVLFVELRDYITSKETQKNFLKEGPDPGADGSYWTLGYYNWGYSQTLHVGNPSLEKERYSTFMNTSKKLFEAAGLTIPDDHIY